MQKYLLSIYQPDGDGTPPSPEYLAPIMRDLEAVNAELRAAGAWVFAAGLHSAGAATVLRTTNVPADGPGGGPGGRTAEREVLITDGPYMEGKEHLGGFTVIQAADLDEALEWGRRMARAITLPIEVRPLQYAAGVEA